MMARRKRVLAPPPAPPERIVTPYVERLDFGSTWRIGFQEPGPFRASTIILPEYLPAAQAVAELRDLADRMQDRFCPEARPRPPAAPVTPMSPEYGQ